MKEKENIEPDLSAVADPAVEQSADDWDVAEKFGVYRWSPPFASRAKKKIPRRGRNHFSVFMLIGDEHGEAGFISGCGSLGEYHTRLLLLNEPDTVDVIEQVGPFPYEEAGQAHGHYLDQLAIKADGRRLAFTDKPYSKVTPEFQAEIHQVREFGVGNGHFNDLYLVTEYARDPIALHNAALMRGCRDPDPEADKRAIEVIVQMREPASLRSLVEMMDLGPPGFRALVRQIRKGAISALVTERIGLDTMVKRMAEGSE